jgi:predicted Zn-dependent peptidase
MFKEVSNVRLNESVQTVIHNSGLTIVLIPKKGFSKSYAIIAANYGSVDTEFIQNGETVKIPDGTAHFLEHKLFEHENKNAFDEYAKTGASANAYTSFDKTAYLFSATSNFKDSLRILLDFSTNPYFTEESVNKEQGIIGQEITMYDDDPGWRVLFNLLEAIFVNNPVKLDIAGTKETISHITADLLYKCYNNFYNLHNMVLCVCGDVPMEDILQVADEKLTKKAPVIKLDRKAVNEPKEVAAHLTEQDLSVSRPIFYIGFKENDGEFAGREGMLREITTNILLEMIAGKGSLFFEEMYKKGLISGSFETEYMAGRGFALSILGGESDNPKAVCDALLNYINDMKNSFDEELFKRCVRVVYGRTLSMFDSVERLANGFISCYFNGMDILSVGELFGEITPKMGYERLNSHFNKETMALSIINPVQG